ADVEGYAAELSTHEDELNEQLNKLAPTLKTKDDSAAFKDFKESWTSYKATSGKVVAMAKAGNDTGAFGLLSTDSQDQFDKASGALGRLVDASEEGTKAEVAVGAKTYSVTQRSVMGAIAACVLLGLLIALGLTRNIAQPVR